VQTKVVGNRGPTATATGKAAMKCAAALPLSWPGSDGTRHFESDASTDAFVHGKQEDE
jgi:hypothetical protein